MTDIHSPTVSRKREGFVYFLCGSVGDDLIVKIGYTRRHPDERHADIQPCSPVCLDFFGYVVGGQDLEKKFHRTFAPRRLHGEWFLADGKLHDFIWYLAGYGAAVRVTTEDELAVAIFDVILSRCAPHPDLDEEKYLASADMSEWEEYREAVQ